MRRRLLAPLLLALALVGCADQPTTVAMPVDFRAVLPAPPQPETQDDVADTAAFFALRADPDRTPTDVDRFAEAGADAAAYDSPALLDRFLPSLALPGQAADYPATLRVLNDLQAGVAPTVSSAKDAFARSRPYVRFHLAGTCDPRFSLNAPGRNGWPSGAADSYPSGHAARGWSAALVLAALRPARAAKILARGKLYGDNRVVCGVHYPSDVAAGRLLAEALVERLHDGPAFQRDLSAAAAEFPQP